MTADQSRVAAKGNLRERPVPRLIQQIFRKRVTGSLAVTDGDGDLTRVYLRDGFPVHADRPNDIDRLDRILVGSGMVPDTVIAQANAEVNKTGKRLGDILIARKSITREGLAELLKTQMRRKLTRLFFARQGTYEVHMDPHNYGAGDEFDLMRLDPRAILYQGIRASYDEGRLKEELAPLAGHSFRVLALPNGLLEAMGFATNDPTVVALRGRALTLEDLNAIKAKPNEVRSAVLALLYSDLLDARPVGGVVKRGPGVPNAPADASLTGPVIADAESRRTTYTAIPAVTEVVAPNAPKPAAAPAPPASTARPSNATTGSTPKPGGDALRQGILDLNTRMEQMSYFELLGVPETATNDDVNAAYMRAVRQYHPDRLAAAGLREIAAVAERVMARMGEAVAVLTDRNRRSDYIAKRSGSGQTATQMAMQIIDAEKSFQRGEVFMKKADYANALSAFAEAMKQNPKEPQYRAYHAWARFEDPRARKDVVAREALSVIQAVTQELPHFGRGHYWIGQIRKHLNDMDQAERSFREAFKIDSTIIEAERELRLLEMRKAKAPARPGPGTATAAKSSSGLVKKLFGKD